MAELELRADCARCAALCCIALAFDQSEWFAFDKAAHHPCPHLLASHRCAIHHARAERGFRGCVHYDCYGAGQHVTELFGGLTETQGARIAPAMLSAFTILKHVHELLLLLHEAAKLELSPANVERRAELVRYLRPAAGFTAENAVTFDVAPHDERVREFLRSLRNHEKPGRGDARRRLPLLGA